MGIFYPTKCEQGWLCRFLEDMDGTNHILPSFLHCWNPLHQLLQLSQPGMGEDIGFILGATEALSEQQCTLLGKVGAAFTLILQLIKQASMGLSKAAEKAFALNIAGRL